MWVKIDDGATEHPKLVDISDAGLAMWLRALCYCGRRRNDGLVPVSVLRILSRSKTPTKVAAELVEFLEQTPAAEAQITQNRRGAQDALRPSRQVDGRLSAQQAVPMHDKVLNPATDPFYLQHERNFHLPRDGGIELQDDGNMLWNCRRNQG